MPKKPPLEEHTKPQTVSLTTKDQNNSVDSVSQVSMHAQLAVALVLVLQELSEYKSDPSYFIASLLYLLINFPRNYSLIHILLNILLKVHNLHIILLINSILSLRGFGVLG